MSDEQKMNTKDAPSAASVMSEGLGRLVFDVECPHCGDGQNVSRDDGIEDGLQFERECRSCETNYMVTAHISVSFSADKADCLNDGQHDYRRTNTFPPQFERMRCSMCGDEKPLSEPNAMYPNRARSDDDV